MHVFPPNKNSDIYVYPIFNILVSQYTDLRLSKIYQKVVKHQLRNKLIFFKFILTI